MGIPPYPACRPLILSDKPLFDELFARLQPRISELTFANLFLFRGAHAYTLALLGDSLVIFGQGYDETPYVLPPLTGNIPAASARLLAEGVTIYGADEQFLALLPPDPDLEIIEDRASFDYLYRRQELADLAGKLFHKKKNRVHYFSSRHAYIIERYTPRHRSGCLALTSEWHRVRSITGTTSLELETAATVEALQQLEELNLEGIVVLVAGEVKAFAIGERLNRTTAVCHFEKSDPFLEGLAQLTNREFSRQLFTDCIYVNREQDLGEPGLRDAKLSYHPVELVRKFRVRRVKRFPG